LISSVKRIGGFGTFDGPPRPLLFLEPGTEAGQGDPVARFKQAQKEFIQVAEMADFDPKAKERSAELREKMKRAPQKIARDPARMREAEREGIAPRVRNFVRQAEQERGARRAERSKRTMVGAVNWVGCPGNPNRSPRSSVVFRYQCRCYMPLATSEMTENAAAGAQRCVDNGSTRC
jgi:hypothetical protein